MTWLWSTGSEVAMQTKCLLFFITLPFTICLFVQVLLRPLKALCSFQLEHGAQVHHSKEHLLKNGMYDKPMPKNKSKIKRMEKLITDHNICPRWGIEWVSRESGIKSSLYTAQDCIIRAACSTIRVQARKSLDFWVFFLCF